MPVRRQPGLQPTAAASRRPASPRSARHRSGGLMPDRTTSSTGRSRSARRARRPRAVSKPGLPSRRARRPRSRGRRGGLIYWLAECPHWQRQPQLSRSLKHFVRGLTDTAHPLLVHIIPIRRCNIDCGYCNEYDKVSQPVPTDQMLARIDHLARPRHVGRLVQRRRAAAAPRPRRADPPASAPRHDGRPHHQRLLPCRRSGSKG